MKETIEKWCKEGREKGKKFLLLIVDGSSPYRYDPVYADDKEDLKKKQLEYSSSDMRCVAATFDLRRGYVEQVEAFVGNFRRLTKWQNVLNTAVDNIDEIKVLKPAVQDFWKGLPAQQAVTEWQRELIDKTVAAGIGDQIEGEDLRGL